MLVLLGVVPPGPVVVDAGALDRSPFGVAMTIGFISGVETGLLILRRYSF